MILEVDRLNFYEVMPGFNYRDIDQDGFINSDDQFPFDPLSQETPTVTVSGTMLTRMTTTMASWMPMMRSRQMLVRALIQTGMALVIMLMRTMMVTA